MMSKATPTVLWLFCFLVSACAVSQEKLQPEVTAFIQLLVRANEPTLAEYAKYSGECGGEPELAFMLNECRSKRWDIYSRPCVDFTRQRCRVAEQEPSYELSWLREQFSTARKSYRLISVQSESEGIDLVEVKIGKNNFLLYYNANPYLPGGLVVGVSMVNGKKVTNYLKSE